MLLDILISSSKSHSVQSAENLKIFLTNGWYSQFLPIYLKLRLLQFQNEIDKVIHNCTSIVLKISIFQPIHCVVVGNYISNIISSIIITKFDFQKKVIHTKLTHKIVLMPMIVTPMTINCVVDEPIPSFKYEVADFYT